MSSMDVEFQRFTIERKVHGSNMWVSVCHLPIDDKEGAKKALQYIASAYGRKIYKVRHRLVRETRKILEEKII